MKKKIHPETRKPNFGLNKSNVRLATALGLFTAFALQSCDPEDPTLLSGEIAAPSSSSVEDLSSSSTAQLKLDSLTQDTVSQDSLIEFPPLAGVIAIPDSQWTDTLKPIIDTAVVDTVIQDTIPLDSILVPLGGDIVAPPPPPPPLSGIIAAPIEEL